MFTDLEALRDHMAIDSTQGQYFVRLERRREWSVYRTLFGCNSNFVAGDFTTRHAALRYIDRAYAAARAVDKVSTAV